MARTVHTVRANITSVRTQIRCFSDSSSCTTRSKEPRNITAMVSPRKPQEEQEGLRKLRKEQRKAREKYVTSSRETLTSHHSKYGVMINHHFKHFCPLRNGDHHPVAKVKFFGEAETEAMSDNRARRKTLRSRSAIPGNMLARHDLKSGKEVPINYVQTGRNINSGEEVRRPIMTSNITLLH